MKKNLVRITLAALFMVLATGSICWAKSYGPWTMTLYTKYCAGNYHEKWGCKGYLHYRLDWNRNRSGAKSACDSACRKQRSGAEQTSCLKGCQNAYSQEK